jgi:hypothetical protein
MRSGGHRRRCSSTAAANLVEPASAIRILVVATAGIVPRRWHGSVEAWFAQAVENGVIAVRSRTPGVR